MTNNKKDKLKKKLKNPLDFDLLYDVLISGGSLGEYHDMMQDRTMPQERKYNKPITEDDILTAWILGKDLESELYARGGHIHQDQPWMLNPNNKGIGLLQRDLNQNSFTSGTSESDYTPTGLYSSDSGHNYTAGIPYVQQFDSIGSLGFNVAANVNGASDDPYAKFIMGDTSGGFLQLMMSQKSSLREGANYIKSLELNFGVGDNAYLAQQYNQMQPIARSTMDADAVDKWKWIFDPSGIMHSWGLIDYDASEGLKYLNSIAEQVENRNKQNFNTAVTNSNKLNLWNQLSQPYMAACGGKMKNRLASGGYINSHYDYITDPLVKVDAGGTHQENPNEGVLTSIAPDGQPNLVEEGETIINNQDNAYVFSDRIVADDEILKSHLLPNKFAGKTYANISKELDKIIEEHKNDEISKRTFDEMISRLQQALEDQKFQEKQEEVEKFLDGLTDEQKEQLEQTMVDEAQAEQQAAEEQAVAELQAQEQAAAEQGMHEQAPEQAPEQVVMEQPEELIVPSRYDQMMSRAQFADAANQGMFGLGGHINLVGNKLDLDRYESVKALYDLAYNNRYGSNRSYYNYPGFTDDYIQQLQAIDKFNSEDSFKLLYPDLYPYLNPKVTVPFVNTNNEQNSYTPNLFYGIENWNSNNRLNNSVQKQSSLNDASNYASGIFYKPLFRTTVESNSQENPVGDVSIRRTNVGSSSTKSINRKTNISQPITPIVESQTIETYSNPHRPDYSIFGQYIPGLTPYEVDGNLLGYTDPFGKFVPIGGEKNWDLSTGVTTNKNNTNTETKSTVIEEPEKNNNTGSTTDYSTWLRYAPAIGSGIQYLSDLFGVTNRNNFHNADLYQRSINAIPNVGFTPLGNYMTYSPLDETYQLNVARSQYNAARRAIQNNASGNASAALAAMDSLNGNMNNTFGDLALQSRQYNDAQRKAVQEYNTNIAHINALMSLTAQQRNQMIAAEKARLTYNLALMRQSIEDANDMAKSANFNNLMTNLGNIGRENYIMNQVNNNLAYYYRYNGDGTYSYKYGLTNAEREAAERYAKENGLTIK